MGHLERRGTRAASVAIDGATVSDVTPYANVAGVSAGGIWAVLSGPPRRPARRLVVGADLESRVTPGEGHRLVSPSIAATSPLWLNPNDDDRTAGD
jgi:hypothetical protein